MMSFECPKCFKIVFDHFALCFNKGNLVFLCNYCLKYQYASRAVWAYAHVLRKIPGCALIGACTLIRTNMVCLFFPSSEALFFSTLIFLFIHLFGGH